MSYSDKNLKAMLKSTLEYIGKDDNIGAAMIPDSKGKPTLILMKGEYFQDMKSENDEMKKLLHNMAGVIFQFGEPGSDRSRIIKDLELMATDGLYRFLAPDKQELVEYMNKFNEERGTDLSLEQVNG